MHLLFDIDGTVIDHRRRMYGLYQEYGRAYGLSVLGESEYFERKRDGASESVIAKETLPTGEVAEYLAWKLDRIETADALQHDVLVSGIKEALEALATSHLLVALSARQSKVSLVDQLDRLGLRGIFQTVLCVGPTSAADGKAAAVESYIARMGISPESIVLLGDSEVEIAAARRSGTLCVSVDWGIRGRDYLLRHQAQRVVGSPAELCDVVAVQAAALR